MNFQMFKLVLEKAEEPEIKLPTSAESWKKQERSIKNKKTGVVYKDEEEWKALQIPVEDIRRDVLVKIPKLDF